MQMGFDLTYQASTKKCAPLFGNKQNDKTNKDEPEFEKKSTVLKNTKQKNLWETLDDGKFNFF